MQITISTHKKVVQALNKAQAELDDVLKAISTLHSLWGSRDEVDVAAFDEAVRDNSVEKTLTGLQHIAEQRASKVEFIKSLLGTEVDIKGFKDYIGG